MKALGLTLRIVGAALLLLTLQAFWGRLWLAAKFSSSLGPQVLSSLFVVLALALVAANSSQQGWKLSGVLFVLYFGINQLNTLDEALLFKVGLRTHEILQLFGAGFCTALVFTPLLVLMLGCWRKAGEEEVKPLAPRTAAGWFGRIVLGDLLYVLCYFVAGVAAFPFVKDFYAGFKMPDMASRLEMEIFRGFVYVAAGLAVASGMQGERGRSAATLALAFPILAGVAPLLVQNPYLPDYVRLAHAFEIGTSNLAYGALLGHFLTRKAAPAIDVQQAESARSVP